MPPALQLLHADSYSASDLLDGFCSYKEKTQTYLLQTCVDVMNEAQYDQQRTGNCAHRCTSTIIGWCETRLEGRGESRLDVRRQGPLRIKRPALRCAQACCDSLLASLFNPASRSRK
jgi:hypothetical protein